MKTEFQGRFYNGTSSKPYPCTITLGEHSIRINITDESGNIDGTLEWSLENISKDDIEIGSKIRLKYGNFPHQTIEVQDEEFSKSLHSIYPYYTFAKRDFAAVVSKKWITIAIVLLVLTGTGVVFMKVLIPSMAEYAATKVPLSVEQTIGTSAYNQISASTTENTGKSLLVQEFFDEMNLEHHYNYTITVLNSSTVNAFAVPGGRIAIYKGILDEIDKPEELAALLAHESSHVELQHSLKSIFRSLSGYFIISLFFGDMGGITAVILENIYQFQHLQYSRKMEKEADLRAIRCLQEANIDPYGMIALFNTIDESSPEITASDNLSEFISTHPLTKHRINYIQKYLEQDTQKYQPNNKLDSLFKLIKAVEF